MNVMRTLQRNQSELRISTAGMLIIEIMQNQVLIQLHAVVLALVGG